MAVMTDILTAKLAAWEEDGKHIIDIIHDNTVPVLAERDTMKAENERLTARVRELEGGVKK